ncbi:helix-turn-helix domain-containing protein [Chryseobacterium shigense]|uniref:Transcriptional regulator with XRE-family HTH domain n=1 Tax=Chryseobacterium shigense TaxID=297244 RepID=A0A841NJQ8_9FLAO|nr:helix-turn-helix transcriptional regulator [Chryseobacterium shigense]MBB6372292.1 transcriptional regulator with XRE-family HTH domain [Chryseobacterium shigense]
MSRLKQIREQQNLTQEELSEKSGISVRTIQRIESGIQPKGHTLKTLSKTLGIQENELLDEQTKTENEIKVEEPAIISEDNSTTDYSKIKLINMSSILFVVLPPLNILAPFILSYTLKQKNPITKQIITLQIFWTVLAPVLFMLGIFLKLGRSFTIVLLALIVLSNIFLILRNTAEIDRKQKLRYKLNFNIL